MLIWKFILRLLSTSIKPCSYEEFQQDWLPKYLYSMTAKNNGIINIPEEPRILNNLYKIHTRVTQRIHKKFGDTYFTINSGYRCPELNARIGGKKHSQHLIGQAIDFEIIGIDNKEVWQWCSKNLNYDQCILERYPSMSQDKNAGWIHISYNAGKNRRQSFTL